MLIDPRENLLITLLQVAKLHTSHPRTGADVTVGDVPDNATRYMAFTYTGNRDSFWDGLSRLTEAVIMSAMDLDDDRYPSQRAFDRMLLNFALPPLHVLPEIAIDGAVANFRRRAVTTQSSSSDAGCGSAFSGSLEHPADDHRIRVRLLVGKHRALAFP